ncbi:MAG: hypothetical protein M3P49_09310 [Actinomycetota bacterium]|nr:hypothetical protein [Actinomycetota bacterium]
MPEESNETQRQPNEEAAELFLEVVKDAPERQIDNASALDTKMVQIFGAASLVIGLAGFSSISGPAAEGGRWATVLFLFGLLAFVLTAFAAFVHLRPRKYQRLGPDKLWDELYDLPIDDLRHSLIDRIGKDFAHNRSILEEKARTLRVALVTTGAEVFLVGLALVFARAA